MNSGEQLSEEEEGGGEGEGEGEELAALGGGEGAALYCSLM